MMPAQASLCRRMVKSWASADEGIMNQSCQQEHYIYKSLGVAALLRAKVWAACRMCSAALWKALRQYLQRACRRM